MKVVIAGGGTGGHLMPALALAQAMSELDVSVEPVLVGAKRGVEASILPSRPYKHYLLSLQPIYRREWWKNFRWPMLALKTKRECGVVLERERPAVILGTGGYAAGPVLFWALRRGLPVAIQEQNAFPGLTTRWLARRARQVHLGFPEAAEHLRPGLDTALYQFGNPITPPPEPRPEKVAARAALGIPQDRPVVLVTGGSQGARVINETIAELLCSDGLDDVVLLWSTGKHGWEAYSHLHEPPGRTLRSFWDPIAEAYAAADVVIGRAGAMTTAELCAWGLPSILIPLPSAAANHQQKNAEAMARAGAAAHITESELTPTRLKAVLEHLLGNDSALGDMKLAASTRGRPDAARNIAKEVLRLVS